MLSNSFFQKPTLWVAKNLIGKTLVRKWRGKELRGVIIETEAYAGFDDKASHASRGRTARTDIMFREAGRIYVYLIYGMHHCLNIVTEKKDFPSAILIRGVEATDETRLDGPGKVTKYFHIDKTLNCAKLGKNTGLWIENTMRCSKVRIRSGPRHNVSYAGKWAEKPWRFYSEGKLR